MVTDPRTLCIRFYYSIYEFYHNNTLITIEGSKPNTITQATAHQLNRMLQTNVIATFHSISMIPTQPITTTDSTTGPVTDE